MKNILKYFFRNFSILSLSKLTKMIRTKQKVKTNFLCLIRPECIFDKFNSKIAANRRKEKLYFTANSSWLNSPCSFLCCFPPNEGRGRIQSFLGWCSIFPGSFNAAFHCRNVWPLLYTPISTFQINSTYKIKVYR